MSEPTKRRRDTQSLLLGVSRRLPAGLRGTYGRVLVRGQRLAGSEARGTAVRLSGLEAAGQRNKARDAARKVAGGRKRSGAARLEAARYLVRIGDAPGAWDALDEEAPPVGADPLEWRRTQAWAQERLGRYAAAGRSLAAGQAVAPDDKALRRATRKLERTLARLDAAPATTRGTPPAGWTTVHGRILHIAPRSITEFEGGSTIRIHAGALAQREAGLDPIVLSVHGASLGGGGSAGATTTEALGDVDGVRYLGLEADGVTGSTPARPLASAGAQAAASELHPAAVQASTPFDLARIAFAIRAQLGIPAVYEVRGFREEGWIARGGSRDADRYTLERDADARCMAAADAVVTLGEAMKAEIVSRGIPEDRVNVVPNSVDVDRFQPGERPADLAGELGFASDDVIVGSISTFQRHEDFATFVEAMRILHGRGVAAKGLLVGAGPQSAAVAKQVREASLEGTIVLPGSVPRAIVPRYHQLIDIFVLARRPLRITDLVTPLKPFEAMASGKPVVISRTRALLEVVDEGRTGLAFEPEDVAGLADVLARLIADPGERHRLGDAARAWVVAERSLASTGQRYRDLYERLGAV